MFILELEKLFGNLKKCTFFTHEVDFLGFIVTGHGMKVDQSNLEAIWTSPIQQSIHDVPVSYTHLTLPTKRIV